MSLEPAAVFFQLVFGKPFQFLAKKKKIDSWFSHPDVHLSIGFEAAFLCRQSNALNLLLCFLHSAFKENESLLLYCQDWVAEEEELWGEAGYRTIDWGASVQCQGTHSLSHWQELWSSRDFKSKQIKQLEIMTCKQQDHQTDQSWITAGSRPVMHTHKYCSKISQTYSLARWSRWASFSWWTWRSLKTSRETRQAIKTQSNRVSADSDESTGCFLISAKMT